MEKARLVIGKDSDRLRLGADHTHHRNGDFADLVADAVLGRDALGEIDLRTGDRGPGLEVIVAAGREEPRHDGNSRQNEYLQTFHMPFYFTDLYV